MFRPGAERPSREIIDGIGIPHALLFDEAGHLFVLNCTACIGSGARSKGWISEFAPGSDALLGKITQGINNPASMALGGGLLFVANAPGSSRGSVTVYDSTRSLVQTITDGIDQPHALAVSRRGNLYVANCAGCAGRSPSSVTVYTSNGWRLVRTITAGIQSPSAMAIGEP